MAVLRRVAATGLVDTCVRLVHTEGAGGDYGHGEPTYPEGASMACLFQPKAASDAQEESEVLLIDANLYLARTATLDPDDRIRVTHLHGDAVASPQVFEIVKGPVLGKTLLEAGLRLVTDGSDIVEDE